MSILCILQHFPLYLFGALLLKKTIVQRETSKPTQPFKASREELKYAENAGRHLLEEEDALPDPMSL